METTAATTPIGMLLPDNITDIMTTMVSINSTMVPDTTTAGLPKMMDNSTGTAEPRLSTAFMVFYFCMRFLFAAFGMFGNPLTVIAVVHFERLQNNTNYLICSLAVADMLGCIILPVYLAQEMLVDEPVYVPLCLIHRTISTISNLMNFFSILGIAIDRYLFIAHGIHYAVWVTFTRVYTIAGITWVFGIAEITAIIVGDHHLTVGVACKYTSFLPNRAYMILLPQVAILMVLTVVAYVAVARIAYAQGKAIAALNQPYATYEASLNRQQTKIAKMMGTVLGTYFACYIPQGIGIGIQGSAQTSFWLHYEKLQVIVYWANIWLNPLIYAWKSEDFRVAFRKLLGFKPANQPYQLN